MSVFVIQLTVVFDHIRQIVERDAATVTPAFFKAFDWLCDCPVIKHVTKKGVVVYRVSSRGEEESSCETIMIIRTLRLHLYYTENDLKSCRED